jgi:DinB superfamily
MKRFLGCCILLLSAAALGQQTKSPVSDVLREMLASREKNTVAAFEEMPADKFGYKPTPEQMTFGHLAAHIVSGNYFFCSNAGDVPRPKPEELKGTEDKDKLVASLKASFEFCRAALAKADDSKMNENIIWFDGKPRPRAWAFMNLASSWADHYGMAAMYLRLNGLFPPTAKPEAKK